MRPVAKIAPLVFVSGACALVYQIAWVRELRLVFGASTAASAAVLAIFLGGLGAGGLALGRRADRHPAPLLLYARLELAVAATAALTPLLLGVTRWLYLRIAASAAPVPGLGTVVRLLLAALVLGPSTMLMGGTLPAAARAAARDDDPGRRDLAVLYGVNTLGAVLGAGAATFLLLELFGTRLTLWLGCLVNLLVAMGARTASGALSARGEDDDEPAGREPGVDRVSARFALAAAAALGFAFVLMEIVWYRMLAPVLGGSSYTFGLVLAVALLGVGLGGAARAAWAGDAPATMRGFAFTCAMEALCLALPYALGDRVAVVALLLRPLGGVGLYGLVAGWAVVAAIVILPAALVSGWQFPLLVALLGSGGRRVGRDVALAYAWNTAGAIAGSLAGGFGLLPLLTAPGVWRVTVWLLAVVGVGAAALALRGERRSFWALPPVLTSMAAISLLAVSRGPSAAWRHSAIGAGREGDIASKATPSLLRDWVHKRRREVAWEADGVESSVAMTQLDGYAFLVNGKVDGHLRGDAPTQVMSGLLGALMHPHPTRTLVIGLGTGSSAGWLGAIPSMERVDVIELEPAIVRVARDGAPINHDALDNPRVHLSFGDAREALLTSRERYDVIFSEPSNPYRAGVSSLFTRELYRAVGERLAKGGIFLQWLQAYEIDGQALHTAYATISAAFPVVETWTTSPGDLILLGSFEPIVHDTAALRERSAQEPYRTALRQAWRVTDVEGIFAHYVARPSLARFFADEEGEYVNTDDRNLLEFAFARTAGRPGQVDAELLMMAESRGEDRPEVTGGEPDWVSVEDQRLAMNVSVGRKAAAPPGASRDQQRRADAYRRYALHDMIGVVATWQTQPRPPTSIFELEVMGEALAELGDPEAEPVIARLREDEPVEAEALLARLRLRQRRRPEAAEAMLAAFDRYHADPWPDVDLMRRTLLEVAPALVSDRAVGRRLYETLGRPFVLRMLEGDRLRARVDLAMRLGFEGLCVEALAPFEPDVPWNDSLMLRARCYRANKHPLSAKADRDLEELVQQEGRWMSTGLMSERAGE